MTGDFISSIIDLGSSFIVTLKTAKEIDHLAMNVPFHSRLKIMGEVI